MLTLNYDSQLFFYFFHYHNVKCFMRIKSLSRQVETFCKKKKKKCKLSVCMLFKKSPTGQQTITFIRQRSPK